MLTQLPRDLPEAFTWWLSEIEGRRRAASTAKSYRAYIGAFLHSLKDAGTAPTLDALNVINVRAGQTWLLAQSDANRQQARSHEGAAADYAFVSRLKSWSRGLWELGVYATDPLARLHRPRMPRVKRAPYSEDEVRRLYAAARTRPQADMETALLLLQLDTGCRIGELLHTAVQDVNLADGTILFRRTKNGRPRRVVFRVDSRPDGGPCEVAMRAWLATRDPRVPTDTLFLNHFGEPLLDKAARNVWDQLGRAAGVPNPIPHRARHTAASAFLAARPGAELQLRARLGHIDQAVLSDYITWSDPTLRSAAEVASISTRLGLGSDETPPAQIAAAAAPSEPAVTPVAGGPADSSPLVRPEAPSVVADASTRRDRTPWLRTWQDDAAVLSGLDAQELGRRIAAARQAAGLSQRELAHAAGVSHGYIGLIEKGHVPNPGKFRVDAVARALGVTTLDALAAPPETAPETRLPIVFPSPQVTRSDCRDTAPHAAKRNELRGAIALLDEASMRLRRTVPIDVGHEHQLAHSGVAFLSPVCTFSEYIGGRLEAIEGVIDAQDPDRARRLVHFLESEASLLRADGAPSFSGWHDTLASLAEDGYEGAQNERLVRYLLERVLPVAEDPVRRPMLIVADEIAAAFLRSWFGPRIDDL